MAATKITSLTSISAIDTAVDPLPIVDVSDTSQASSGTTKKVTVDQIESSIFGATGSKSIVVDNVAALKALTVASVDDGQVFLTRGYYTDNDGGQGAYIYDSASSTSDNGGTVIAPTSGSGRFLLQTASILNVKQFGAKGDGSTNDLSFIQNAAAQIKTNSGGALLFPSGTYRVVFPSGMSAYDSLVKMVSKSTVRFDGGALMSCSAVTGSNLYASVFGIDQTALPVSNVNFENLNMIQDIPSGGQESTAAVMLTTAQNGAANSITDVEISGCRFVSFSCPIYILQRTSAGTTTRQVNGVKIVNNFGNLNPSFITADGKNITIANSTATGDQSLALTTYDGVSIHSGINIEIIGNSFSYFGEFGVNIRNSAENLCGSKNISIVGNIFENCALKSISVSLQSGETTYGVECVSIGSNVISNSNASNSSTAILVDVGSGGIGTPLNLVSISSNTIKQVNTAIQVQGTAGVLCKNVSVVGNSIYMGSSNSGYSIRAKNVELCGITSNSVYASHAGASYKSVDVDYFYQSGFSSNQIYLSTAYSSAIVFNDLSDSTVASNSFSGKYVFTNLGSSTVVDGNKFASTGTCEGRVLNGSWTLNNSRINYYGSSTVSGSWYVGDQVFDTPSAGGYIGKVCVTAGSPGTFKDFGAIVP